MTDSAATFEAILASVQDQVPAHANPRAIAKSIYNVLSNNPDVGFNISSNAQAHNAFEFPSGLAVTMHKRAPVQMDLMKRAPVTALVICDLGQTAADGRTPLSKEYFRDAARVEALRKAAPQYSPLSARELSVDTEGETAHWEAELGKAGWISVAATKERTSGTRKQTRFHLAVRASAGQLDQEYYNWIKAEAASDESLSIGSVAEHPHTVRLQQVAKRNAQRIAYQAARALGVKVATIKDFASVYARSREFAPPLMAVPNFSQLSNILEVNRRTNTVTVHSNTTPSSPVNSDVVVLFNPHEGFGRFAIDEDEWGNRAELFPVGMRRELPDHQVTVEGEPPRHFVPSAQADRVARKFAPSNRYAPADAEALQTLSGNTGKFTHYKHVSLLTCDSSVQRADVLSATA